jgi:cytochrome b
MTRLLHCVVFAVGLAAVCWIGAGYVNVNPLALAVTALIGAVYALGGLELFRYQTATARLAVAIDRLTEAPASLGEWLAQLPPTVRNAVRLRTEGERVGLPGPTLTPYLVGLLVLLGMLGTFLGMIATLRGTGLALESSTDLAAIRASLAAPVKGLGFAFGTSVAGVATSAMLGLLSALCRRERLKAAQLLDTKIATTLRVYSPMHQREETFKLLQRQADIMPTVVDRLEAMMTAMAEQNQALNERMAANQDAFHGKTDAAYTRLAATVEQTLKDSVVDGARTASAAIQPAVEATMAGLAREAAALHDTVTQAVQQQLDGLSTRFETSTTTVAEIWQAALAEQRGTNAALAQDLRTSLEGFAGAFDTRTGALLDNVSTRLNDVAGNMTTGWREALSQQERANAQAADTNQAALTAAAATFTDHSAALVRTVGDTQATMHATLAAQDEQRLAAWNASLAAMAATLREQSEKANADTAQRLQAMCDALAQTAQDVSNETRAQAAATLAEIDRVVQVAADAPKAAADLQKALADQDQARLSAWTASLADIAATLREESQQTNADTAQRLQAMCDALAKTATEISSETRAQAASTLAEIDRVVQVAADAPKAAADLQKALADQDQARLAAWTASLSEIATTLRDESKAAHADTARRMQEMCDALAQTAADISSETRAQATSTLAEIDRVVQVAADAPKAAADLQTALAAQDQARLAAWTASLADIATTLREESHQTNADTAQRLQAMCDALAQTAADISSETRAQATSTLAEIERVVQVAADAPKAAADLQAALAAQDQARLAAWTNSLAEMATTLREEWQQAGAHTAGRSQAICDALAQTARDISSETQAHASSTIAEIAQLVQAASEAPRAAADVVIEVRQKLSDSMARDNAMLEERSRLLDTLGTLLDAVNHASTEQRTAVDALVATSADVLDRVGTQFIDRVEAETTKLTEVAAQVTVSAVDVASLGESFGTAVQLFSESNTSLVSHLQRIEAALDKSTTRSDEQLAYYVAQAREVIDLSMMAQKQILEDLQHVARAQAPESDAQA